MFLILPIEVYRATNVRKNFVTTKFWRIFILSHLPPLQWEGEQKPCITKLLSYLVRNNMESYYPCTWLSFVNQKNEKKKKKNEKLMFVNENYIYWSYGIIFQNNISVSCIRILCIRWQLKHHQFRRSEIFILLEIILNVFNVWLKSSFWL